MLTINMCKDRKIELSSLFIGKLTLKKISENFSRILLHKRKTRNFFERSMKFILQQTEWEFHGDPLKNQVEFTFCCICVCATEQQVKCKKKLKLVSNYLKSMSNTHEMIVNRKEKDFFVYFFWLHDSISIPPESFWRV